MNKRFNYEQWYNKQNSKKSDILYERLTKEFVGKNLLNEQVEQEINNYLSNLDLAKNKQVLDAVKPIVADKLSWLGIDFGTTEGRDILQFATKFFVQHFMDLQPKDSKTPIKETPSMLSDFIDLMKMIILNAAKENKELFKQFSSISRAKAGAEAVGKQIGRDVEEFGAELGRTGKQTWSDIKSGLSNLFEAAPAAAGAGGTATAVTTGVVQSGAAAVETAAPQVLRVVVDQGVKQVGTRGLSTFTAETAPTIIRSWGITVAVVGSLIYLVPKAVVALGKYVDAIKFTGESAETAAAELAEKTKQQFPLGAAAVKGAAAVEGGDGDKKTPKGKKALDPSNVGTTNY